MGLLPLDQDCGIPKARLPQVVFPQTKQLNHVCAYGTLWPFTVSQNTRKRKLGKPGS